MPLFRSTSYLMPTAREMITTELLIRVADAIAVLHAGKSAHWTVRGPMRQPIHEVGDMVYKLGDKHMEEIAERAAALGATPALTLEAAVGMTKLTPYPTTLILGEDHARALGVLLSEYGPALRETANRAKAVGDVVTENMLIDLAKESDAVGGACVAQDTTRETA